jgi:hypothetical protein
MYYATSVGKKKAQRFGIPMVWRQPINHVDDCYFCMCTLKGFNTKNKKAITYPNLPSAIRPVPHGPDIPVPNPPKQLHTLQAESSATPSDSSEDSEHGTDTCEPFTQTELNGLVRDLNLPKDAAELLGSRLKGKNLLTPGTYDNFIEIERKIDCSISPKKNLYCIAMTFQI